MVDQREKVLRHLAALTCSIPTERARPRTSREKAPTPARNVRIVRSTKRSSHRPSQRRPLDMRSMTLLAYVRCQLAKMRLIPCVASPVSPVRRGSPTACRLPVSMSVPAISPEGRVGHEDALLGRWRVL